MDAANDVASRAGYVLLDREAREAGVRLLQPGVEDTPLPVALDPREPLFVRVGLVDIPLEIEPDVLLHVRGAAAEASPLRVGDDIDRDALRLEAAESAAIEVRDAVLGELVSDDRNSGTYELTAPYILDRVNPLHVPPGLVEVLPVFRTSRTTQATPARVPTSPRAPSPGLVVPGGVAPRVLSWESSVPVAPDASAAEVAAAEERMRRGIALWFERQGLGSNVQNGLVTPAGCGGSASARAGLPPAVVPSAAGGVYLSPLVPSGTYVSDGRFVRDLAEGLTPVKPYAKVRLTIEPNYDVRVEFLCLGPDGARELRGHAIDANGQVVVRIPGHKGFVLRVDRCGRMHDGDDTYYRAVRQREVSAAWGDACGNGMLSRAFLHGENGTGVVARPSHVADRR